MKYQILCLKLKNGNVSPLAKTKRELSKSEMYRRCKRFRRDDDYDGECVLGQDRLRLEPSELRQLPEI
ncbi:hypothetical protein EVB81_097 [Rhizobium phage RHph_I46]|uniref:Uncharacterized protein n=1 Tax=Rhizobium phage RHph_I1_9 TaxID=2509729 RepID=A0A7S5UXM8_9CAUD|nr:hypothetical protein PP936_gp096 [Rhizobium phage RHph_I1_9]QIG69666.1 hypothetical protein EVB81_097 [Rhizobium phage RHph_I46]QIG70947.1 hypothetical protein EVB92_097 [Rhizobium phage RHph_I9]QIG73533.1 hypothetical protein EVC04_096 [Rhizobium phage RHph_I1_9]QIG76286.1 hypothetical protein EVC25_097 [Rhizobium phage RHph_I34]